MPGTQEQIYSAAADGVLVLTANRRLFRHLREGFDCWMQEQGRQAWSTRRFTATKVGCPCVSMSWV